MFCAEMCAAHAAADQKRCDAYRTPVPDVAQRGGTDGVRAAANPSPSPVLCPCRRLSAPASPFRREVPGTVRLPVRTEAEKAGWVVSVFYYLCSAMGFGFLDITLIDVIDVFVVALIMFQIYRFTRGTNALRIVVGILLVYLLWVVVKALNMELLSMILGQVIGVGVIALIVVFQPELRRFLTLLGTQYTNRRVSLLSRLFRPRGRAVNVVGQEWIETVIRACSDMAATKTGALIVIARSVNLLPIIEKGERIDALISAPLLENIFFKNSPLHDGAVVIANGRIAAAKCVLPSTEREVPMEFGMRHRAALGASEVTDALVVVVSEERGTISVARKGHISRNITPAHLRVLLRKGLSV